MRPERCVMCAAPDCASVAEWPNPCPTYHAVREALLPPGTAAHPLSAVALFWLAQRLGEVPLPARRDALEQLLALFGQARRSWPCARRDPAVEGTRTEDADGASHAELLSEAELRTLAWMRDWGQETYAEVLAVLTKIGALPPPVREH